MFSYSWAGSIWLQPLHKGRWNSRLRLWRLSGEQKIELRATQSSRRLRWEVYVASSTSIQPVDSSWCTRWKLALPNTSDFVDNEMRSPKGNCFACGLASQDLDPLFLLHRVWCAASLLRYLCVTSQSVTSWSWSLARSNWNFRNCIRFMVAMSFSHNGNQFREYGESLTLYACHPYQACTQHTYPHHLSMGSDSDIETP